MCTNISTYNIKFIIPCGKLHWVGMGGSKIILVFLNLYY